jgi:hypothetical protein
VKPYENVVTFEATLIGYAEAINRFDAAANETIPWAFTPRCSKR